jgi:hypothetical protein
VSVIVLLVFEKGCVTIRNKAGRRSTAEHRDPLSMISPLDEWGWASTIRKESHEKLTIGGIYRLVD